MNVQEFAYQPHGQVRPLEGDIEYERQHSWYTGEGRPISFPDYVERFRQKLYHGTNLRVEAVDGFAESTSEGMFKLLRVQVKYGTRLIGLHEKDPRSVIYILGGSGDRLDLNEHLHQVLQIITFTRLTEAGHLSGEKVLGLPQSPISRSPDGVHQVRG